MRTIKVSPENWRRHWASKQSDCIWYTQFKSFKSRRHKIVSPKRALAAFSRFNCCESNVWARCYWYILLYYLITASIHGTAPQQLSCWTIMAAPLDTINVSKRLSNQDQNKEFYELTNKRMLRSVCRVKRTRVHDIEASNICAEDYCAEI